MLHHAIHDREFPAVFKFAPLYAAATVVALLMYQFAVRLPWLRTLLNGPRKRRAGREAAQPTGK